MLILALDTTSRAGSVALARDAGVLDQQRGDPSRTHGERLPGDIGDLLERHGLTVADVDLYAVAAGPGSFTGLRVGIATIQGLALAHARPVVPVSALVALAHGALISSRRSCAGCRVDRGLHGCAAAGGVLGAVREIRDGERSPRAGQGIGDAC